VKSYRIRLTEACLGPTCCNRCKWYFDQLLAGDIHDVSQCDGQITVSHRSFILHQATITRAMQNCPQEAIEFQEL
jgi:hypothetical protein